MESLKKENEKKSLNKIKEMGRLKKIVEDKYASLLSEQTSFIEKKALNEEKEKFSISAENIINFKSNRKNNVTKGNGLAPILKNVPGLYK